MAAYVTPHNYFCERTRERFDRRSHNRFDPPFHSISSSVLYSKGIIEQSKNHKSPTSTPSSDTP